MTVDLISKNCPVVTFICEILRVRLIVGKKSKRLKRTTMASNDNDVCITKVVKPIGMTTEVR